MFDLSFWAPFIIAYLIAATLIAGGLAALQKERQKERREMIAKQKETPPQIRQDSSPVQIQNAKNVFIRINGK